MGSNPYWFNKWANRNKSQWEQRTANENKPHRAFRCNKGGERETRHGGRHDKEGSHFTRLTIPDPPPLKVEWQGGSGIRLSVVDHVDLISTVRELRVQFRTPPLPLKAEQQGGSGMEPQS
jgi:hypothetical protein